MNSFNVLQKSRPGPRSTLTDKTIWNYFDFMCANTSTHGGNWLVMIRDSRLKSLYLLGILGLQGVIFYIFVNALVSTDSKVLTSISWEAGGSILFPYVTVCNPRIFSKPKVDGWLYRYFVDTYIFCNIFC